jgi:hypothetical protein
MNPRQRTIQLDAYKNNIFTMPIDGRILGFDLFKVHSKIIQNKYIQLMSTVFKNNEELRNFSKGSGMLIRVSPHDHHQLSLPYEGKITAIAKYQKNGFKTVLRVENDYYIAPHIPERDQFSIAYGKCLRGNRGCETRLFPQEDTKLVYYIVIMGSPTFKFIDSTLEKINKSMSAPKKINIDSKMFTPDKIIGTLGTGEYLISILSNRPIHFENDIKHNSRIENEEINLNPVETLVNFGNRVGEIF